MVLTGKQEPACRQKLQQMRDTLKERAAYGNKLGWKKKSHGQQNKKLKCNQNNPRTRAAGGESVQIPCSTLPKDVGSRLIFLLSFIFISNGGSQNNMDEEEHQLLSQTETPYILAFSIMDVKVGHGQRRWRRESNHLK